MIIEFIGKYWRIVLVFISIITFIITITKLIANSYAINKIRGNHIKHLQVDIKKLEKEDKKQDETFKEYRKDEKEFKKEIKDELHDISLFMRRIERKLTKNSTLIDVLNKNKQNEK